MMNYAQRGLQMIDFRVETFIQVCKYMNYTKAAKALHITQPAVSQHIRYMEQEYGVTLFQFQGKKMMLTEEGERLLNAATTLKHDDLALKRMFKEEQKHTLTFGVTLTIGEYVIGKYLASYMKDYPDTDIRITIANTEELLEKVDDGEIDFALVEGFFDKSKYDFQTFRKERYIGVCAPYHSLAGKKNLKWEELLEETLISREHGSGTREILERRLSESGYGIRDFRHLIEISNMSAIKMMVVGGCGISFLYETAAEKEIEEGSLAKLDVEGFPVYHDFTFVWRKNSIFGGQYKDLLVRFEGMC